MRMVFTAPGIVVCDMLRGMLESDGIQCFLRNEPSSTIGLGDPIPQCPSLSYAWPEVWVSAEDFERAMIIAANFNHAEQAPSAEKE
jgi:hypothetical protein